MMHYGPWIHHQGMLDNRQYYLPYVPDMTFQQRSHDQHNLTEEESEPTGDETHDTTTPATSGERSSSADLFRLEFAAAQWSKLVSNAEGLFNKLMTNNVLPHTEQDQIEQWLCMKQEYEECIASDETASMRGFTENTRRSLERIEEVTETDEKTDESVNQMELKNNINHCSSSESDLSEEEHEEEVDEDEEDEEEVEDDDEEEEEEDDEEDQSDACSENPDFLEKLDECMNKLKIDIDRIVDSKKDVFAEADIQTLSTLTKPINANNNYPSLVKPTPIRNQNSRRNSMLPGSELCNTVLAFNNSLRPCPQLTEDQSDYTRDNILDNRESDVIVNDNFATIHNDNSPDLLLDAIKTAELPEPIKELKTLTMNNEAKQTQVRKIQSDLDGANKRIEELQTTIKIKEKFIADMIKNSDTRSSAKQKFQRKWSKLEEDYYNTRTQLAQAENASLHKGSKEKSTHNKKEVELYKSMAIRYEKRLMDIEVIKQIAGDSARKVLELESSLNTSKKQMEKLKRQLKKEEERKRQLEEELAEDQKKIRELEEKYNLTASKLKEMQSESEDERNISRPKLESQDKKKNIEDVSARISHLDHVLKEKSMDLERTTDTDAKEALRHEIRNLRRTRDCLIDEKCDLDEKYQQELLTTAENRERLECGETIEAIDDVIEHKNEMICGRTDFDENQSQREKGERMLMERLSKLSYGEMRTLIYKYFRKVIDLKESSKNLEVQNAQLEAHIETQEMRILALVNAWKQAKLEAERRIVLIQREHEEKLHYMFRHYAEETSSSGHERLDVDSELAKCKRENRVLKKQLAHFKTLFNAAATPRRASPPKIPQQELKQIAPSSRPMTKVTRQRNKLIIQDLNKDKRKK